MQTGLRNSEITGLRRQDVELGVGAHVRCVGKGRKLRCTPLRPDVVTILKSWLSRQPGTQADPLHHQRNGPVGLLQSVDVRDARMVQRREDFGFALEPGEPVWIARHRSRQHFEGDLALQVRVGGSVDFAIPPTPSRATISCGPRRVPGISVMGGKRAGL